MTVYLKKDYLLNLNLATDFVVVLRRYDEGSAPWGVHVVTVDFQQSRYITHRTVGLCSDDQVLQIARRNDINYSHPYEVGGGEGGFFFPAHCQVELLVGGYVWTQLVPMEWQDVGSLRLDYRVFFLAAEPMDADVWYDYDRQGNLDRWGDLRRLVTGWVPRRSVVRLDLPEAS